MKVKLVTDQIVWRAAIALLLVGISTIVIITPFITSYFSKQEENSVIATKQSIIDSLESADKYNETIERVMADNLDSISKGIATDLRGKDLAAISNADLNRMKLKYGLNGLSLMTKKGAYYVVPKSSEQEELGLDTKEWGSWNDAFKQLEARQPVTVDIGGYAHDGFWMGPPSKAAWGDAYYMYGYYYDGTSDYILNPYKTAAKQLDYSSSNTKQSVSKLMTNNPILMDITVVNARPYLQKEQTDVVIPNLDTPILAGSNEYTVADDDGIIAKVLQTSQEQSDRLKRASGNLVKYYIPLPQERVLMVVINHGEAFENTLVIVVITGLAFLVAFLVIFLMIRSIARNRLKPLGEIGRFIDVVSKGDFGGTLDVKGDNEFGLIAARIKQMALKLNLLIDELNAKAEQEIYRMAYYDDLTQLPNRRHFMQTLASRLKEAKSTNETFAVMFMDLDGFKEVNDQFGHDVGDLLLQETASRLQGCLSTQDMIARLGGDEFTVILSNNQVVEGIPRVCRSILDSLQQECVLNSHPIRISVSIGIAVYPFDGLSIYDLLKSADIAMYKAKENGKNNYWTAAAVDSVQETEMNIVKTKVIRQRTGAHVRIE